MAKKKTAKKTPGPTEENVREKMEALLTKRRKTSRKKPISVSTVVYALSDAYGRKLTEPERIKLQASVWGWTVKAPFVSVDFGVFFLKKKK